MLNKALRVQNLDILFAYRFLITDIHNQLIKESSNTNISRLYRGQMISNDELDRIRSSTGEFISINSFLSTTRIEKKATEFAQSAKCEDLECVLFKIKVDNQIKAKPFADISRLSYFLGEEEILLMLGSIFRLESVHYDKEQHMWVADLDLCNEDDHDLKEVFAHMKKEMGSETTLISLGDLFREMGELDKAEKYYKRLLSELTVDDSSIANCYRGLGIVHQNKGEYDLALMNYEKALKIRLKALPPDHPDIALTYRNIGLLHEATRTWQSALEYHSKAAEIRRKSLPTTHPQLVITENDIRRVKAQLK
ncbi:unnamed protein product [Didymodactylos carnosus]|uniref:Uncharacterized protein n=1 Tax=Didymodactylos carnosus TaxID=1234261 RepID=A0A814S027_9BILA|nr:unnamed protein product [Didymodactylos carnosus]CAF1140840.1 unnamed protein product [Didymodactylos carnosus]CAF3541234.1 unnamed protein product [Didymodactylos carnosus]CAF3904548.1 unnamed protein product [Didymodactylos carnosus]